MTTLFGIDIASLVATNIGSGLPSVTLSKVAPGVYDINDPTNGNQQVLTTYTCKGTLIRYIDATDDGELTPYTEFDVLMVLGTMSTPGTIPDEADQISCAVPGTTRTVNGFIRSVSIDPAGATATIKAIGVVSASNVVPTMAGVSRDALSGIYCPANAAEWAQTLLVAGLLSSGPSLLWLCQEPNGNLADAISAFTGTVTGAPITYNQAVAGWTRTGIFTSAGGTGMIRNTDAGLPDVSSMSSLVIAYIQTPGSAALARNYVQVTPALVTRASLSLSSNGRLMTFSGPNQNFGTTTALFGTVQPFVLRVNRTNGTQTAFNAVDKIVATFSNTITGKALIIGGDGIVADVAGSQVTLYVAEFFGNAAELTDAQLKILLITLGWPITWF